MSNFAADAGKSRTAILNPPIPIPLTPTELAPSRPRGNDSSVSKQALRLMLVRTHLGRMNGESSADIGVVRESPQTYMEGAVLENGARVKEIHSDFVLLEVGGRQVRLYLESVSSRLSANDTLLTVGGNKQPPPIAAVSSTEVFADYVRASPVYEGDSLSGYQVYAGRMSAVFFQTGLQPGDVIVRIGDTPLNDPQASWEIFRAIGEGLALPAVVRRHDTLVTITLDGSLIQGAEEARNHPVQAATF